MQAKDVKVLTHELRVQYPAENPDLASTTLTSTSNVSVDPTRTLLSLSGIFFPFWLVYRTVRCCPSSCCFVLCYYVWINELIDRDSTIPPPDHPATPSSHRPTVPRLAAQASLTQMKERHPPLPYKHSRRILILWVCRGMIAGYLGYWLW